MKFMMAEMLQEGKGEIFLHEAKLFFVKIRNSKFVLRSISKIEMTL